MKHSGVISQVVKFAPLVRTRPAVHIPSYYWNCISVYLIANEAQAYDTGDYFQHLTPYLLNV